MEGAPPVANQIDLFMHFLGASRDGLVARRVDLDTISSSVFSVGFKKIPDGANFLREGCPHLYLTSLEVRGGGTLTSPL